VNLSSLPIFSRVYVIVKLDPIIDSDPSFILLLRKDEETEDSFMVVDSDRTIIGCSDYLYHEFPSIRGFINSNLRNLSLSLVQQFEVRASLHLNAYYSAYKEDLQAEKIEADLDNLVSIGRSSGLEFGGNYPHHPDSEELMLKFGDPSFEFISIVKPKELGPGIFYEAVVSPASAKNNTASIQQKADRGEQSTKSKKISLADSQLPPAQAERLCSN